MARQDNGCIPSGPRGGLRGLLVLGALGALTATASAAPVATDVGISQSATPDPANVARELTYTLTATNVGPAVPRSLVVSDSLPAAVKFVKATPSAGGACATPTVGTSGTVRCTWDDPPVGSVHTVAIVVTPTSVTTLVNTASANPQGAQDPVGANDSATTSDAHGSVRPPPM
jgi:uncharacterized repeat protein (TIGR01451 family)